MIVQEFDYGFLTFLIISILFIVYSIFQIRLGLVRLRFDNGSRLKNRLRIFFAIPILFIAIFQLILLVVSRFY